MKPKSTANKLKAPTTVGAGDLLDRPTPVSEIWNRVIPSSPDKKGLRRFQTLKRGKVGKHKEGFTIRPTLLKATPLGELVWINLLPLYPYPATGRFIVECFGVRDPIIISPGQIVVFVEKSE